MYIHCLSFTLYITIYYIQSVNSCINFENKYDWCCEHASKAFIQMYLNVTPITFNQDISYKMEMSSGFSTGLTKLKSTTFKQLNDYIALSSGKLKIETIIGYYDNDVYA